MSGVELYQWARAQDFRRKRSVSIPRVLLSVSVAIVVGFAALFVLQNLKSVSERLDSELGGVPTAVEQLQRGAEMVKRTASVSQLNEARLTSWQREDLSRSGASYAVDCAALGADWAAIAEVLGDGIACGVRR